FTFTNTHGITLATAGGGKGGNGKLSNLTDAGYPGMGTGSGDISSGFPLMGSQGGLPFDFYAYPQLLKTAHSGQGGNSFFAAGGYAINSAGNGLNGLQGSGGSGGFTESVASTVSGGNGGDGVIVLQRM